MRRTILQVLSYGVRWLAVLALARGLGASESGATHAFNQRCPAELGVRNGHALTYDGQRRKVVLYGGADAVQVCADTWAWDGRQWSRMSFVAAQCRSDNGH